jgi:hypothetical protein
LIPIEIPKSIKLKPPNVKYEFLFLILTRHEFTVYLFVREGDYARVALSSAQAVQGRRGGVIVRGRLPQVSPCNKI